MEREDELAVAGDLLRHFRYLEECPHGYLVDGDRRLEGNWGLLISEFRKGQAGAAAWSVGMSQRGFTDLLQDAYDQHLGECAGCLANREDD